MKLYEIDKGILECFDLETGEILDEKKLEELQLERDKKIENVGLFVKNLEAEKAAVKAEKDAFAKREKSLDNKIKSLKNWLKYALGGDDYIDIKPTNFVTSKIIIGFRKSESVEVDENVLPKKWFRRKVEYTPDKTLIKEALNKGQKIKGAFIKKNINVNIK